ncbi:MAG: TonB-dependent receptor [Thermodesulfobacteriota bacterium]
MEAGFRVDSLDWNIAGNTSGTNPNILSELQWKDLNTFQLKGGIKVHILRSVYVRGGLKGGWIYSGDVQDSDYLGNNRTLEISRSNNSADSGTLWDASAGIGFSRAVNLPGVRIEVAPLVGYSRHRQNLTLTDGFQTIPPSGSFSGLDSTYKATWKGPWFGTDVALEFDGLTINGAFEYHIADYDGEADWNLRSDFQHPKSFEHTADGSGVLVSASASYAIGSGWSAVAGLEYMDFQTDPGLDRTFFTDGTTLDTQLNEVNWDSFSVTLGLLYTF